jgi:hypothetical protein
MLNHTIETDISGYVALKGFDGYRVNVEKGLVINARNWVLGNTQNAGYNLISMPGKCWLAHRLIYTHAHGSIPAKMVIDHKDGNKLNNSITNLQAISHSQNIKKAWENIDITKCNFAPKKVTAIRLSDNQETSYDSIKKAIADLGVAGTSIRYCLAGKTKTAYSTTKKCRYGFKPKADCVKPSQSSSSPPASTVELSSVPPSVSLPL